jgi:hypothetical protein
LNDRPAQVGDIVFNRQSNDHLLQRFIVPTGSHYLGPDVSFISLFILLPWMDWRTTGNRLMVVRSKERM